MRVLILNSLVPFVRGGAEIHAEELCMAVRRFGHEAEIVNIPFCHYPPERIPEQILACRLLDVTSSFGVPTDLVIGLKFPAYLIPHPNKVLWILHQHRQAYDLWDSAEYVEMQQYPLGSVVRDAIRAADRRLIPEAKRVFANSQNVARRLFNYCGLEASPLYHPPRNAEQFFCAEDEGYLLFPSRLSGLKRQDLVLKALALTTESVRVRFVGAPDLPFYREQLRNLSELLGVSSRVEFVGHVTEAEKRDLYAHARGVIFPPYDEDYGYITLEAMLASKPVITCSDSGGPLEFVAHGETGVIAEPTSQSFAEAMDELWASPERARQWGKAGRAVFDALDITWDNVVARLLA